MSDVAEFRDDDVMIDVDIEEGLVTSNGQLVSGVGPYYTFNMMEEREGERVPDHHGTVRSSPCADTMSAPAEEPPVTESAPSPMRLEGGSILTPHDLLVHSGVYYWVQLVAAIGMMIYSIWHIWALYLSFVFIAGVYYTLLWRERGRRIANHLALVTDMLRNEVSILGMRLDDISYNNMVLAEENQQLSRIVGVVGDTEYDVRSAKDVLFLLYAEYANAKVRFDSV